MMVLMENWKKMNSEKLINFAYFVLGIVIGVASSYLKGVSPFALGAAVYLISFGLMKIMNHEKKKLSWYLTNSLLTYALVWVVTWIFVYNL